ncbi:hypothetical protein VVD49_13650 [Uliginosibacterium sp. H3]|uniref:Uncharacterized protein n=1 Tax=Uliginosibacterium silvisoli TaxID=3114758 RepID=A0ABU6K5A1_9RHOO|nr:hypothetical protein [Uliginosibacterium sp. H3]
MTARNWDNERFQLLQNREMAMPDEIIQYKKGVFTNDGQSDVDGFAEKLEKMARQIKEAGKITVYYGFHGTEEGKFSHAFDEGELEKSLRIAKEFPEAMMVQISSPTDSKIDYKAHDSHGHALFTWCDSENYIRANKCLPNIVG